MSLVRTVRLLPSKSIRSPLVFVKLKPKNLIAAQIPLAFEVFRLRVGFLQALHKTLVSALQAPLRVLIQVAGN